MSNIRASKPAKIVSIVSGKGGSGKTLMTAMIGYALARENQTVLLVDNDIFVRGLTILLDSIKTDSTGTSTVSDFLGIYSKDSDEKSPSIETPYIVTCGVGSWEFHLLPAVKNVSAPLDYDDRSLSDQDVCEDLLDKFLKPLLNRYDFIILDNRAGMDSLITASCLKSDIVLAVDEDDRVGFTTNQNVREFLQGKFKHNNIEEPVIYHITNKARGVRNIQDIDSRREKQALNFLGVIPFDMDVMEGFGAGSFWKNVGHTLYFNSIIKAWNQIDKSENIKTLYEDRKSSSSTIFVYSLLSRYSLMERLFWIYGLTLSLIGVVFLFFSPGTGGDYNEDFSFYMISSIGLILMGIISLFVSSSGLLLKRSRKLR